MATKSLLFVGAGAVGSYIGAFLSRAGHDVTYIDPWPEQVEAIRTRGISVTGPARPVPGQGQGAAHPRSTAARRSVRHRVHRDEDL